MQRRAATQAIHGRRDSSFRSANYPIYNSTTFAVERSADYAGFGHDRDLAVYTRHGNPTIRNVEEKLARLEQAEDGVLFASGMAAITTTLLVLLRAGDAVAAASRLYGATYRFLRDIAPGLGIDVHFLDVDELYDLEQYAPTVKVVYFETPVNPTSDCLDIRAVVAAARRVGALTVMDNTFASPINQNPLPLGVDLVVHSVTKYLAGHSDLMAGAVLGPAALIEPVYKAMTIFGGCSNPHEAALLDRSLKTLAVRVAAHNQTAQALAEFFAAQPQVRRVHYPGLPSSPVHEIARQQMRGFGGMLAIELADLDAASRFCDALEVALNATSLGSVETLVSIPVLTSHTNISDEELRRAGVTPGTIRISAGLEDVDDLLADFQQALGKL
jgi:cystathionine beta-lyase/cystathionine gamma-synthase